MFTKKIDICLTPELIGQHDLPGTVVVVVDIFRATSSITTAIAHGVKSIKPVDSLQECKNLQQKGYFGAAERGGKKVGGFDLGNSPYSYMNPELEDQSIAMTTTNGTSALKESQGALQIIIGSFLNISALVAYLERLPCDVLIHCAGWKGKVNLEDTLFAGAVIHRLKKMFSYGSDAPLMASSFYQNVQHDIKGALEESSHFSRLVNLGFESDIDFCLQFDQYKVIPLYRGDHIVKMKLSDMLL